VNVKV